MATIYTLDEQAATIKTQAEIITRQRQVIEFLLSAIWISVNAPDDNFEQLQDAYRLASSQSTMTGTSEE